MCRTNGTQFAQLIEKQKMCVPGTIRVCTAHVCTHTTGTTHTGVYDRIHTASLVGFEGIRGNSSSKIRILYHRTGMCLLKNLYYTFMAIGSM